MVRQMTSTSACQQRTPGISGSVRPLNLSVPRQTPPKQTRTGIVSISRYLAVSLPLPLSTPRQQWAAQDRHPASCHLVQQPPQPRHPQPARKPLNETQSPLIYPQEKGYLLVFTLDPALLYTGFDNAWHSRADHDVGSKKKRSGLKT